MEPGETTSSCTWRMKSKIFLKSAFDYSSWASRRTTREHEFFGQDLLLIENGSAWLAAPSFQSLPRRCRKKAKDLGIDIRVPKPSAPINERYDIAEGNNISRAEVYIYLKRFIDIAKDIKERNITFEAWFFHRLQSNWYWGGGFLGSAR